ncbi:MAG TPA: spermidine synthase, partial [Chloroflexi bacterium]|nr:spermidine synthase [Chloroflexota bacterium]
TFNQDARHFLNELPADTRYDFIFGDAFNDFSVPYHLTTREFASQVRAHLAPDGLYLVNIIDGRHGLFLRAFVRTLQSVFPHVAVSTDSDNWRTVQRYTFVLVASEQPLDDLYQHTGNFLSPDELQRYLDEAPSLILTDDHVPVDNLLAPVYRESGF